MLLIPALSVLLLACTERPTAERAPPTARVAPEPPAPTCLGTPPCEDERIVHIDLADIGGKGTIDLPYDFAELTGRVRLAQMSEQSDVSVAVRLLLAEIGPERMLANQHAREESLAILATVRNRLDPAIWNPESKPADPWPGCDTDASFANCATPEQYLGLGTWRALHPEEHIAADRLGPAVEAAVSAWWLLSTDAAEDPTGGATSFVHRCGGTAYGQPTTACDGAGDDDVPGAEPHTGPVVFRGPQAWDAEQGRYRMWRRHQVDYEPR